MKLISIHKAMKDLGVGRRAIESLISSGKLKTVEVGSRRMTCEKWMSNIAPDEPVVLRTTKPNAPVDMDKFYADIEKKWLN